MFDGCDAAAQERGDQGDPDSDRQQRRHRDAERARHAEHRLRGFEATHDAALLETVEDARRAADDRDRIGEIGDERFGEAGNDAMNLSFSSASPIRPSAAAALREPCRPPWRSAAPRLEMSEMTPKPCGSSASCCALSGGDRPQRETRGKTVARLERLDLAGVQRLRVPYVRLDRSDLSVPGTAGAASRQLAAGRRSSR